MNFQSDELPLTPLQLAHVHSNADELVFPLQGELLA